MSEEEPIDAIVKKLKASHARRGHQPDWGRLGAALRAFVAELGLDFWPGGEKVASYRRVGAATASVTDARALLEEAKKSAASARELPKRLGKFAAATFGRPGLTLIPPLAVKNYVLAFEELDACLSQYEELLKKTLALSGNMKGAHGPLLSKTTSPPIVRFLQRLIPWWREATGREPLGEGFEDLAKQLLEITLSPDSKGQRAEVGDLKRQIENAKRLGPTPRNEWDLMTDLMNDLPAQPRRKS